VRISIHTADNRETVLAQGRDEGDDKFRERVDLVLALLQDGGAMLPPRREPTAISVIQRAMRLRR
jgi:hypothetical protein